MIYSSLNCFLHTPQRSLLAYPHDQLSSSRITQLQSLGVTGIYNYGSKSIQGWHCLGLGYCGLVLLVQYQDRPVALKVRRVDAPRDSFDHEAAMLTLANLHQVGPQLLAASPNFLLMNYVAGQPLMTWLQAHEPLEASLVQQRLIQLLEQAFRLDQVGLDHGNLRCVTAHCIVTAKQPILLDFSNSSTRRRQANLTSLTSGLFWGTIISRLLVPYGIQPNQKQCIDCLRQYKHSPTLSNFNQLLSILFEQKL